MARPRQYASVAAKQAAYRARQSATTVVVDRAALDRLHARLETLQSVMGEAAQRGDVLARQCRAASIDTMLDRLIAAFQAADGAGGKSKLPGPINKLTNREK